MNIPFEQTLRDIILLFLEMAELDKNLEEGEQFCRKAWQNEYDYLQFTHSLTLEIVSRLSEFVI